MSEINPTLDRTEPVLRLADWTPWQCKNPAKRRVKSTSRQIFNAAI